MTYILKGEFSIEVPFYDPHFSFHFDTISMKVVREGASFRLVSIELINDRISSQRQCDFVWKAEVNSHERDGLEAKEWIVNHVIPLYYRALRGEVISFEDLERIIQSCQYPQLFSLGDICPFGRTISYSELTLAFGYPLTHVRYVARMLAQNKYALLIPCHRVVHKQSRAMPRYQWGSGIKLALQEFEMKSKPSI